MAKDKSIKIIRQSMKPISFGKPAAMGSPKIVYTARKKNNGFTVCEAGPAENRKGEPGYWGIRFCVTVGGEKRCGELASGVPNKITEWKRYPTVPVCRKCVEVVEYLLTPAYFKRFPEIVEYHAWGKKAVKRKELSQSVIWDPEAGAPRVVRERGGCDLSAFLNNPFQSMIADITKLAYIRASRECYLGVKDDGSPSPLAGCRLPIMAHDELVSELILSRAHEAGTRITEIMVEAGNQCAPDVKAWKADTALAYWLTKAMEPVHDANGRLVPWDEEKMVAWRARHPEFCQERMAA